MSEPNGVLDLWYEGWDMCRGKPVYNFCMIRTWASSVLDVNPPGLWDDDYEGILIAIGNHVTLTPPIIPQPDEN